MSLYANPREHAANPPETWRVVPRHPDVTGRWNIVDAQGAILEPARTKREALARIADRTCPSARLWEQERRWYAGETIPGWRPYAAVARLETCARPLPIFDRSTPCQLPKDHPGRCHATGEGIPGFALTV